MASITFFAVVGISLFFYWFLPKRFQWGVLLLDSLLFYFANATYYTFVYVCISVLSVYFATRYFVKIGEDEKTQCKKKCVLLFTLMLNIGILAALKYLNFAIHTFGFLNDNFFHVQGISDVSWIAPLAISYYTLQLISYLLDCYWGMAEPFSSPLHLGLYTIYFPLMTCGPICRFDDLGKQLFEKHSYDSARVRFGLYRIVWGLLKKIAISNRLAVVVDRMWESPVTSSGINVWISTILFSVQLYTDFSGCMDIALGVSECFGIILPENFKAPFYSRNMQEVWRRWHITLGTWLKDYIMNPVLKSDLFIQFGAQCKKRFGKKNGRKVPVYFAMLILWSCMGVWHGNSWKYIVGEGLWFWLVIVSGQIFDSRLKKITEILHIKTNSVPWHTFQTIRTFLLFSFGMLFFRAQSLPAAFDRITAGCCINFDTLFWIEIGEIVDFSCVGGISGVFIMVFSFILVLMIDYFQYKNFDFRERLGNLQWSWSCIIMLVVLVLLCLSAGIPEKGFLYAQF